MHWLEFILKLDEWFESELGKNVSTSFHKEMQSIQEGFKGEYVIQLGNCGTNQFFSSLRYLRKWIVAPELGARTTLLAPLNALPFAEESVDCVIAPLINEIFPKTKSPLDEIDRILKPMGHIIFFGVNPFSFWGGWLACKGEGGFTDQKTTLRSSFSIKRAMHHRGYMQLYFSSFYFMPPIKSMWMINKLSLINELGKVIPPWPSSFYCLVVQKCQENPIQLHSLQFDNDYLSNKSLCPSCYRSHFY